MRRISVELIPRDEENLREQLAIAKANAGCADVINVPDLLRFPVRSWEGAAMAQDAFPAAMPHIRAMDIDLAQPLPMKDYLRAHNIREVLVIEGDVPQDMRHKVYPTTTVDVLWKFHNEMPEVKTYAGIDQYRGSMSKECYRIERKLQAGAEGFFTQPFFDLRFVGMYADLMEKFGVKDVYWGVTPVLSEGSKGYWERKNKVVFPKAFETTLDWSIHFAKDVMRFAEEHDANLYVMPIKTDLEAYLAGVFSE